jgi:hypothetical protein
MIRIIRHDNVWKAGYTHSASVVRTSYDRCRRVCTSHPTELWRVKLTKLTIMYFPFLYITVSTLHIPWPPCARSTVLLLLSTADWPSKSICKSAPNFRWTLQWPGGLHTAVYKGMWHNWVHQDVWLLIPRITTATKQLLVRDYVVPFPYSTR